MAARAGARGRIRDGMRRIREGLLPSSPSTVLGGQVVPWMILIGLSACFLWSAVSGPFGAASLLRFRKAVERLEEENAALLEQNHALEKEIYLLRNSPSYLERVARERYGYIRKGEKVYAFSEPGRREARHADGEGEGGRSRQPPR